MKSVFGSLVLLCGVVVLGGCAGIQGRWESTGKVRPADAVTEFNVGEATFSFDGTYEATMTYAGTERKSTGTYTYSWNNLELTPSSGGTTRKYDAKLVAFGGKMDIEYEREDYRDIHVEMRRAGCAKDCKKSCCKAA